MNKESLNKNLPTLMAHLERRRKKAENQLPKHLRPLPRRPIVIQMVLNAGIAFTLLWLMSSRDDFMTEAVPALGMVVCLLLLIYTLITAMQLKQLYQKTSHDRLAKINVWMMWAAALLFPISVAFFLP